MSLAKHACMLKVIKNCQNHTSAVILSKRNCQGKITAIQDKKVSMITN